MNRIQTSHRCGVVLRDTCNTLQETSHLRAKLVKLKEISLLLLNDIYVRFPYLDGNVLSWAGVCLTAYGFTPIVSSVVGPRLPRAYHVMWRRRAENLSLDVKMSDPTSHPRNSPLARLRSSQDSWRRKMLRKYSVEKVSTELNSDRLYKSPTELSRK